MGPVIGLVYQLKESDYRFGSGTVLVLVTSVVDRTEYEGERWWSVQGRVAIGTVENHGEWENREFLEVRDASLRLSRVRPPDASRSAP